MPGYPGRHITKIFWGDLELRSGARLHARIFGSFSRELLEDVLAELPPLAASDIIVANFGAWYPRLQVEVQSPHGALRALVTQILCRQTRAR